MKSRQLFSAAEIAAFSIGKQILTVTQPSVGHTRFHYTDGTSVQVIFYEGQVYSENTEEGAEISYWAEERE